MRHWLRQTARLDSISFCGAVDVGRRCDAGGGGSIFTPDFLSLSACAHCVRPQSVPLLSFPAVAVLYSSCVLYQICAERDGASLLCPLEPSRRPHPCRLPSSVHYRRGCAAAFRPRGLRTILRLAAAAVAAKGEGEGEGEGCEKQRCTHVYVRQTDQGSFRRVDAQSRLLYCNPAGGVSVRWQSTDEALAARLYMLEEQARPSVPSKSNEPLGATTLHATIGGSTMELLHKQIGRGWERAITNHAAYVDSPTGCPGSPPVLR
jgi:hypothetical protein